MCGQVVLVQLVCVGCQNFDEYVVFVVQVGFVVGEIYCDEILCEYVWCVVMQVVGQCVVGEWCVEMCGLY